MADGMLFHGFMVHAHYPHGAWWVGVMEDDTILSKRR